MFDTNAVIQNLKNVSRCNRDIVDAIRNAFTGRTALVVSAGPSAKDWRKVYEKIRHTSPLIVCVKQAIELDDLHDICDIHFINPYNIKKYKYCNDPLIIFTDALDAPKVFNKYDVRFCVNKERDTSLDSSLSYSLDFKSYMLSATGVTRPWGPGIMYESVFFTLIHSGVKEIHTVGWDIASNDGKNVHFYDKKKSKLFLKSFLKTIAKKLKLHGLYNLACYHLSKKYNSAGMLSGEAELISSSIPALKIWLEGEGVDLEIHSNSSWLKY